jgi:flagellar basal-body rod modification protein FlgD
LSSNFDTFLTLLTTQLKNQDSLARWIPTDHAAIGAVFPSRAADQRQQEPESLILTKSQSATDAVSYLGKTLTGRQRGADERQAQWAYSLDNDAATTTLIVPYAKGHVVFSGLATCLRARMPSRGRVI